MNPVREALTHDNVFFYKLFNCAFCMGFHAGYIVYFLHTYNFSIRDMLYFALTGATASLFFDNYYERSNTIAV